MAEYLSTAELAKLLKLNQKKVYAMAAAGQLPAVRVSGKWLFPKAMIDSWLADHTIHPPSGLLGALLDRLVILQGSDDWLLSRALEAAHAAGELPIPTATIGSIAGLQAVAAGRAHLASCHVDAAEVRRNLPGPAYLVDLLGREQGLIYDAARTPRLTDLADASARGLRFATRQPASGTARLVARLVAAAGLTPEWTEVGPFASHLEVALAVRTGQADVGVGIPVAAQVAGLAFAPLAEERFALAVPAPFFAHARLAQLLEVLMDALRREHRRGVPGYSTAEMGRLAAIGAVA